MMRNRVVSIMLVISLLAGISFPTRVLASSGEEAYKKTSIPITGVFESEKDLPLSAKTAVGSMDYGYTSLGELIAFGDISSQSIYVNAIPVLIYKVGQDVTLSYEENNSTSNIKIVSSSKQKVGDYDFGKPIGNGALLVQKSKDGEKWEDPIYAATDVFSSQRDIPQFYKINNADIREGVFVRIMLTYSTEGTANSSKVVNHTELFVARMMEDNGKCATGELSINDVVEVGIGAAVLSDLTISNRVVGEAVFHAAQGHGFAAEAGNIQAQIEAGKNIEHTGGNNIKNGSDYIVKDEAGVILEQIQCKYYQTASKSVAACFDKETGKFKYFTADRKPMKIEVPKEQYAEAVKAMEKKIEAGAVPGITDKAEAKNIIKPGEVSYKQAVNIAKAGTVDSLKYDAKNSCVTACTAMGISATIQFARSIWEHDSIDEALKKSMYTGLKVGGVSFATSILASQLSRTGLNMILYHGAEEALKTSVGYKAAAIIVNAGRVGASPIYGAAAAKSAAKLFSSNAITAAITLALFTIPDVVSAFKGKVSAKQVLKNVGTTAGGIGGGYGGAALGASIGTAIAPGAGTVIGGIIGVIGGGLIGATAADKIGDLIAEDDAEEMLDILSKEFAVVAEEYLLTQEEADRISEILSKRLTAKQLKEMYASNDRNQYARDILVPIIEDVIKEREVVVMPSNEVITDSLIETLNEIYDAEQTEK